MRPSLPLLFLAATVATVAGVVAAAVPAATGPSDGATVDLATCRARIAVSAPTIDAACLRRVYALPLAEWPAPMVDAGVDWQELAPLPKTVPAPADNPTTKEKVALGERLFSDPKLSRSGQIACASCHDRELAWGDGRSVPFGHDRQPGRRNTPSIAMAGLMTPLFWDGRATSLEAQVLHPIEDHREMASTPRDAVRRIARDAGYRPAFAAAFGDERVDMPRIAQALAAYQRSLVPRHNRFDRFLEGRRDLLDDRQLWGLHLFRTQARCMNCHSGALLADGKFHNLGLHYYGRKLQDLGRYEVTGDPADAGAFRTPSLRNVARTGPYMHNGRFTTLRGVMNLYNVGMPRPDAPADPAADAPPFPRQDPLLHPLDLHRTELEALTEFMETL